MSTIVEILARMILDSRGNPTVEVDCLLDDGSAGRAAVPSGASTGEAEAVELRDGGTEWCGKGVERAIGHVNDEIREELVGWDALDQEGIDAHLCSIDETDNKSRLGANAILATSLAVCRAASDSSSLPLFRYLGGPSARRLPIPLLNVVNGGAHANNSIDFQEFMIAPVGAPNFVEGLRWSVEIYHESKKQLDAKGLSVAVGDEGGFAPDLPGDEAVLEILTQAVEAAGYRVGRDEQIAFALDVAASEFHRDGQYHLAGLEKTLDPAALVDHYKNLVDRFPIISIEDGLDENDWEGWKQLQQTIGDRIRLIGDDLFVTQESKLVRGIEERAANAILIKLNQVGTVSETLHTIELAQQAGFRVVISHRSGETEDHFIADLAVATGAGWIKTGAPCRTDRNTKYNQLLRIGEMLESEAQYGPVGW